MAGVPILAIPVQIDAAGQLATIEQDTRDEIAQNVAVIASTTVGTRPEVPDFGISNPTFDEDIDPVLLAEQITLWEPRAVGCHVNASIGADGTASIQIGLPTGVGS